MITIEINDAQVNAAFARISEHLTDLSDLMNEVGIFLVASTEQRFKDTEAPDGSKWAPRSATTIKRYGRKGQSFGPVLHKTFELSNNTRHQYDAGSVTIGTDLPQSAMMQFGGTKAKWPHLWGNIPARPFIGLSDSDRTNVLDTVAEWLADIAAQ